MTKKKAQIGYEFLDASGNFIYEARETGKTHTPFASEILLFQSIKCGDLTGVKNALNAILGGLDESEAYQLSDFYIQKIDSLQTMEECIDYLCEKAIELVTKVKEKSIPQCYSPLINQCVHLIHIHLHSRLKIEDIAKSLHVSRDYLSQAFKKETGVPLHQYILDQKMEEAKHMLTRGMAINVISYTLCFCNESHLSSYSKRSII